MGTFTKYTINETDNFDEGLYPQVAGEIEGLHGSLIAIKGTNKVSIIISLLKDHCIKTEWLDGNKQLAMLLTSGVLQTSHLESLFNSCKHNTNFTSGLEAYMSTRLA